MFKGLHFFKGSRLRFVEGFDWLIGLNFNCSNSQMVQLIQRFNWLKGLIGGKFSNDSRLQLVQCFNRFNKFNWFKVALVQGFNCFNGLIW